MTTLRNYNYKQYFDSAELMIISQHKCIRDMMFHSYICLPYHHQIKTTVELI
jgi:hypothetical protein